MATSLTPALKKLLTAADCFLERQGKGDLQAITVVILPPAETLAPESHSLAMNLIEVAEALPAKTVPIGPPAPDR